MEGSTSIDMSINAVSDYIRTNLSSETDQAKCLQYIASLDMTQSERVFAEGMVQRAITYKLFSRELITTSSVSTKLRSAKPLPIMPRPIMPRSAMRAANAPHPRVVRLAFKPKSK